MKKALTSVSFLVLLTLFFTLFSCSVQLISIFKIDKTSLNADNKNIFLSLQHESNPLLLPDSPKTLSDFNSLYSTLKTSSFFTYYEIYRQSLDFSNTQENIVAYDYHSQELFPHCAQTLCVQISPNVQSGFSLNLDSGTYLLEDSFIHRDGDNIQVLMGYDYSDIYEIGDTFSADYLFSPFPFEIVGFLAKNSEIHISSGSISLDKYIVMPSFDFAYPPSSDLEYVTQKIHLANKTSGKAKTSEDNFDASLSFVQSALEDSQVGNYSLTTSSIQKSLLIQGINLHIIFCTFVILSLISVACLIYISAKYLKHYIKTNRPLRCFIVSVPFVGIPLIASVILSSALIIFLGMYPLFIHQLIIAGILIYLLLSSIFLPKKNGTGTVPPS